MNWRTDPIATSSLGGTVANSYPAVRQGFVAKNLARKFSLDSSRDG